MKKLITLLFVLVAIATTQAQNIPLTNGDCSTDAALTGVSPYVIPGFTVSDATAKLTVASCGVSNGSLRIVGATNGAKQGDIVVTTDKADISTFPNNQTYSFACTVKGTVGTLVGSINVNITAMDANGTAIPAATAFVGGTVTKLNPNTIIGTAVNYGANVKLVPTAGVAKLAFVLQVGKYVTSDLILDDFTLYCGSVPTVNVTPSTNLALSTEAGVASAESSFTLDGSALTSEVKVYGGASLEYSLASGAGFSQDTIKLAPAGDGSLASTTVYARIRAGVTSVPTASSVMANGQVKATIYNKTGGSKSVQFSGTITGFATTLPTVDSLTTSPLLAYHKNIKITANSLTADLLVSVGSKLEIATDSLFSSAQSSLILPSVGDTVYVRLKKGLPIGVTTDETTKLTITSTGFISKSIQFVGNSVLELAVNNVNSSNIKCFAANGNLYIQGIEMGKQIEIYNNVGQKVKSFNALDNAVIALPYKGIYVVKSDTFIQKVFLK